MFIIGDVHGCFNTLRELIAQLPKGEKIVFVGDLIDRGPRSKEVVDLVMKNGWDCVRGNHEEMMIMSKNGHQGHMLEYCQWIVNGGAATLASYTEPDGRFDQITFDQHVKWMESLPIALEYKDVKNDKGEHLLISHAYAGNVWGWSDEQKSYMAGHFEKALLWGRPKNLSPLQGIYQVHGHTPLEGGPRIKSFYANIDTGAVFKDAIGAGTLTALDFPSMKVYEQKNTDNKSFYWR